MDGLFNSLGKQSGFPAGFHFLGGGVEALWGGSSLGVGGLRVIKNKVSKNFGGSN